MVENNNLILFDHVEILFWQDIKQINILSTLLHKLSLNYNHQRPPMALHQLKLSSQGLESDHQSQKTERLNVYGDLIARKEENIDFLTEGRNFNTLKFPEWLVNSCIMQKTSLLANDMGIDEMDLWET